MLSGSMLLVISKYSGFKYHMRTDIWTVAMFNLIKFVNGETENNLCNMPHWLNNDLCVCLSDLSSVHLPFHHPSCISLCVHVRALVCTHLSGNIPVDGFLNRKLFKQENVHLNQFLLQQPNECFFLSSSLFVPVIRKLRKKLQNNLFFASCTWYVANIFDNLLYYTVSKLSWMVYRSLGWYIGI